jgi:ferrochelatase
VELAMRYQNPSIESALRKLRARGVDELLLIPLFPHYAMSSFETAVVRVQSIARWLAPEMKITVQPPCFDSPEYIAALAASAKDYLETGYDHLLFSFHGIPERHLKKSDPTHRHCLKVGDCCNVGSKAHPFCYRHQCFRTVEEFVKQAGVPTGKFSVSFQSRLGRDPWLKPYTDVELAELPKRGVKKLLVICPAFVSDCLETLEEIGLRGRETFLSAGGSEFAQIPCLNEHPRWIAALEKMAGDF